MSGLDKIFRQFVAIAMLVAASHAHGADARWAKLTDTVFTHIVRESELPDTSGANAIVEDRDGFVWVGMQLGLARWDGHHFRVYQPNAETPGALPDNYINVLHTDPTGRLWIGTNSAGLALHDRDSDRFTTYSAGPDGLSNASINAIIDDGAGGLWVGTREGLDHLDPATGSIRHVRHDENDPTSIPSNRVLSLRRDRSGNLWVGTAGGLARMDRGANSFVTVSLSTQRVEAPVVLRLFEDSAGRIWVGTRGQGVYVIDGTNGAIREVVADAAVALGVENVRAFEEIRPGIVWIGTDSHGIVEVDAAAALQIRNIVHDPMRATSLGDGAIYIVYKDRAGLAWVGTDRSFSRVDVSQTAVSTILGGTHRADGITESDVGAVHEMPDGRIWLGFGKGVDVVEPHGLRIASLRPDSENPERALPRAFVTSFEHAGSDVYIGTRKGVYRTDSDARGVVRISVPHRPPSDDVATLLMDDGVLWVGGKPGLYALDLTGGNEARIEFARNAKLTDQRVNVVTRGPGSSLWVGTESGLNRIDFAARTVEHIQKSKGSDGESLGFITAALMDRNGRLWVGTFGDGISVFKMDDRGHADFLVRVGAAQGLSNGNINQLLEDQSGRMWASTDDGIAVVDTSTFAVQMLNSAEGVAIRSYWGGSAGRTAAGELLFGGLGGLTLIKPDQLKPWDYRPPVVVTGIRVGGKPVLASRFNSKVAVAPLSVTPEANSLAVEFAALDYSAPERTRLEYRLDGYDKNWVEADPNQRVASYTNLSPGTYALRLRGTNRSGVWTEKTLSVPIRVMPAWFQTAGFRAVLVLAGLGLFIALIHARTSYLHHRRRELERQVADRTRELQESQRQLELIAYYDVLTKLPNRRRFRDELSALIARMKGNHNGFALLLIDLDRFKQINDTLGHEAGDQLLQQAATRFKACVSEGDMVARLGGDEFVVLLPHDDPARRAAAVAREMLIAIAQPFILVGQDFRVTGSIGICTYPDDGQDEQTLMKRADIAMYQAKAEGKNNFQFYSETQNSISVERLRLESELRHALEHGEFRLHYQAKRDIVSGHMSGVGTLLCWPHPKFGMMAAAQFMPVAEETGLSVPIGKWALKSACAQNVAWRKQGLPPLSVAVNITARQFCDEQLVEEIAAILHETGMEPRLLELQIAESLMMRDVERTLRTLTALKSLGIRIAIDNFGAGYSSLTTLQRFPLDTITIDRAFIDDITNFDADSTLTDAVIAMGRSLSLTVVAQGVETREQAEFLRKHASDELQGFYFNRPLPAEQFGQLLLQQAAGATYVGERAALVRTG